MICCSVVNVGLINARMQFISMSFSIDTLILLDPMILQRVVKYNLINTRRQFFTKTKYTFCID